MMVPNKYSKLESFTSKSLLLLSVLIGLWLEFSNQAHTET